MLALQSARAGAAPARANPQRERTHRTMTSPLLELRPPRAAAVIGLLLVLGAGCAEPSDDPFQEMRQLYESGQYAESLERLRSLEEAHAGNPEFDLLYARALIESRRPSLAVEPLERAGASAERAVEVDPNEATAWHVRARANLARNRSREALVDIERALELAPDQQSHQLSRVLVLLSLRRYDEAAVGLNKAKQRLAETPDPSKQMAASLCVAEARLILGTSDRGDAGEQITRCVERFPASPFVVDEALDLYDSLDQPENATRVLRGAIEAWPENSRYYTMLANRLREQGRAEEAERFLRQEVERAPSVAVWSALARHYRDARDYERAASAYREALEVSADAGTGAERSLRFAYAVVLMQLGALDEARRLIDAFGESPHADLLRGRISGSPRTRICCAAASCWSRETREVLWNHSTGAFGPGRRMRSRVTWPDRPPSASATSNAPPANIRRRGGSTPRAPTPAWPSPRSTRRRESIRPRSTQSVITSGATAAIRRPTRSPCVSRIGSSARAARARWPVTSPDCPGRRPERWWSERCW
jgi:tetratricopeptide (TPR) repeat protein